MSDLLASESAILEVSRLLCPLTQIPYRGSAKLLAPRGHRGCRPIDIQLVQDPFDRGALDPPLSEFRTNPHRTKPATFAPGRVGLRKTGVVEQTLIKQTIKFLIDGGTRITAPDELPPQLLTAVLTQCE